MTPDGVTRGKDAVREASSRVEDGVDTFPFRDGLIRAQTLRYTLIR